MKRILPIVAFLALAVNVTNAQVTTQQPAAGPTAISLNAVNTAYTQNFLQVTAPADGLVAGTNQSYLPAGWVFSETSNNATVPDGLYSASAGGSNTSALGRTVYNFGASSGSTDRALGAITGGSASNVHNIKIGVKFINNTSATITTLVINFTGEQWRRYVTLNASSASPDPNPGTAPSKLAFSYRIGDGSLSDITWVPRTELDFISPVTTAVNDNLDGNSAANRTVKTFTITGLSITNGSIFWLRWEKDTAFDGVNNNDGLAIDDFSVIANPAPLPVDLKSFNYQKVGSAIQLKWATATERNNDHFELSRSADGTKFDLLTKVSGKGNSEVLTNYSHTDYNPLPGTSYYQLKQVDQDGEVKVYPFLAVKFAEQGIDFKVNATGSTAGLRIYATKNQTASIRIIDVSGKEVAKQQVNLTNGFTEVNVNFAAIAGTVYVATLSADGTSISKKFTLR